MAAFLIFIASVIGIGLACPKPVKDAGIGFEYGKPKSEALYLVKPGDLQTYIGCSGFLIGRNNLLLGTGFGYLPNSYPNKPVCDYAIPHGYYCFSGPHADDYTAIEYSLGYFFRKLRIAPTIIYTHYFLRIRYYAKSLASGWTYLSPSKEEDKSQSTLGFGVVYLYKRFFFGLKASPLVRFQLSASYRFDIE